MDPYPPKFFHQILKTFRACSMLEFLKMLTWFCCQKKKKNNFKGGYVDAHPSHAAYLGDLEN